MIRRSSSKTKPKKISKKKKSRKVTTSKPTYTCQKCKKDKFKTQDRREMVKHLKKKHKIEPKRGDGVDLKMMFEILRVVGIVAIVGGIYGVTTHIADEYIESTPVLKEISEEDLLLDG